MPLNKGSRVNSDRSDPDRFDPDRFRRVEHIILNHRDSVRDMINRLSSNENIHRDYLSRSGVSLTAAPSMESINDSTTQRRRGNRIVRTVG